MEENICKEFLQLHKKKIKIHLKMGKGLEQTFLQRWYTNVQQTCEETFHIIRIKEMQIIKEAYPLKYLQLKKYRKQ